MSKDEQLKSLQRRMARCDLPLKETSTCLVFGQGNPDARILFIGQAPGRQEDLCGEPFVGAAGRILDELFACGDLARSDVYITSILKYFPPRNRAPRRPEIKLHVPFLIEQIKIIRPHIIAPMGNFAARFVLGGFDADRMEDVAPITALHGKTHFVEFQRSVFKVMPLFHPAAALYFPPLKKAMRKDFRYFRSL